MQKKFFSTQNLMILMIFQPSGMGQISPKKCMSRTLKANIAKWVRQTSSRIIFSYSLVSIGPGTKRVCDITAWFRIFLFLKRDIAYFYHFEVIMLHPHALYCKIRLERYIHLVFCEQVLHTLWYFVFVQEATNVVSKPPRCFQYP